MTSVEVLKPLDVDVMGIINYLSELYSKCDNNNNYNNKKKRYRKNDNYIDPDFKPTTLKKYEGFEKTLSLIKSGFGKLTTTNYDDVSKSIKENVELIINENNEENIEKMLNLLLDELVGFPKLSDVFSRLYNELYNLYNEAFKESLNIFIKNYDDIITNIICTDGLDPQSSQENYDKYCINNKRNSVRNSMGLFMTNLMKYDIIKKEYVISIINYFQDMLLKTIDEENKKSVVDELTENILTLTINSKEYLKDMKEWESIKEKVKKSTALVVKEHKSYTSRSKFKHMDILDSLK
jgi:hypothetical protein